MQPAVHIGIFRRIGMLDAGAPGVGLFVPSRIVEINERFAIDRHGEDRKIRADPLDIIDRPHFVQDAVLALVIAPLCLAASQTATWSINSSRKPACSMPSTASPTKAWIRSDSASLAGIPRALR